MMKRHHYEKPSLANHRLAWRRRLVRNWPFLLWLGVLAFIASSYSRNQQFGQMAGTVESIGTDVVPGETARLDSLAVTVGQHVRKGDVLGQMDTSLIDAQLAIDDATLRDARDAFNDDQRRIVAAADQAEAAVKDAESALKTDQMSQQGATAQVEALRRELKRLEALRAQRLVDETSLASLRPQLAALEPTLVAYPKLIEIRQQALDNAIRHRDAMAHVIHIAPSGGLAAAVNSKTASSLSILEANRGLTLQRKQNATLRASRDGMVARIYIWPGNTVPAGTFIMYIVDDHPSTVVGFLPEGSPTTLVTGETVQVWRRNEPGQWPFGAAKAIVPAVVESVSPAVDAFPARINPIQVQVQGGQPLRGKRIVLKLQGTHDFSPGETVEIRKISGDWQAFIDGVKRLFRKPAQPSNPAGLGR